MTLRQFVVAVAAGAALAIIAKKATGTKGGGTSSGSKPIEGVGTGIS